MHVVCAQMTEEFLVFSKERGNDLSTPIPEYQFPGLKPGDCWCLCASRWQEAADADIAPPVKLASTHISALEFVSQAALVEHALDKNLAATGISLELMTDDFEIDDDTQDEKS